MAFVVLFLFVYLFVFSLDESMPALSLVFSLHPSSFSGVSKTIHVELSLNIHFSFQK